MKKTGKIEVCVCGKEFYVPGWWKNKGAKYHSRECYWNHKHDEPWNKGTKGLIKVNSGSLGHSKTKWNGTIQEYKALHYWIGKYLGKPEVCSNCGNIVTGKKIHWANKSGKYKKDSSDWIRLCAKCHYKFDNVDKRRGI